VVDSRGRLSPGPRSGSATGEFIEVGGLTTAEVADRVARGLRNDVPDAPTRTVREIIRANVFTRFNFLLGSLLIVILIVGPLQDALFGLVLIANTAVGIVQELRAKRTLDRLAVINAPTATVLRDGRWREAHIQDLVLDDVIKASPGDQVVVDGLVLEGAAAELDESLLTGGSPSSSGQGTTFSLAASWPLACSPIGLPGWAGTRTRPSWPRRRVASRLRDRSYEPASIRSSGS